MTGNATYNVPEPYNRDTKDTCDYEPPRLSLSVSGNKIMATIRRGSYNIEGYTLYINGAEQSGISLGSDGSINGYTLKGNETSVRLVISDSSGYTISDEMTLTPSSSGNNSSSNSHSQN